MFPLLKEFGYRSVIFALGNNTIAENIWDIANGERPAKLMNDHQISEMANYGIEFGSHTLSHADLTAAGYDEMINEIYQSKIALESRCNSEVITLSYPWGNCNPEICRLTKEAGYKYGIATDSGGMHWEDDLYRIFRVQIFEHQSMFSFAKKTKSWYRKRFFKKHGK